VRYVALYESADDVLSNGVAARWHIREWNEIVEDERSNA
jgi:hypothetical protein